MAELFKMDDKDLKRLRKFYKRAPVLFGRAAAATLTGFAYGNKAESEDIIRNRFTVRNPRFIFGSLQVEPAKARSDINKMSSRFGSVERPRFSGLKEQELGQPAAAPRNRVFTTAARGGTDSNITKVWARLKPAAKYPSPNRPMDMNKTRDGRDFGLQGLSGAKRIVAFLMILNERKTPTTFIIRRNFGRFKKGLYRYQQGHIKKLQSFGDTLKPKKVSWLIAGRQAFMTRANILQTWANAIRFQLNKSR